MVSRRNHRAKNKSTNQIEPKGSGHFTTLQQPTIDRPASETTWQRVSDCQTKRQRR